MCPYLVANWNRSAPRHIVFLPTWTAATCFMSASFILKFFFASVLLNVSLSNASVPLGTVSPLSKKGAMIRTLSLNASTFRCSDARSMVSLRSSASAFAASSFFFFCAALNAS